MALKKSQKSLKSWTKQKWRTKSGKPSGKTGERYLPSAAIKSLSPSEYAATTRAKRKELVVVTSYSVPKLSKFHKYVQNLNVLFTDLHCMEFHPDYGAEDAELDFLTDNDWESSIDRPYCMVFIQDLAQVVTPVTSYKHWVIMMYIQRTNTKN